MVLSLPQSGNSFAKTGQINRPADRPAEHIVQSRIIFKNAASLLNVIEAIQDFIVLMVQEQAAMKVVRTALGHDVDDGSLVTSISGVKVICNNLEFLYRILEVNK